MNDVHAGGVADGEVRTSTLSDRALRRTVGALLACAGVACVVSPLLTTQAARQTMSPVALRALASTFLVWPLATQASLLAVRLTDRFGRWFARPSVSRELAILAQILACDGFLTSRRGLAALAAPGFARIGTSAAVMAASFAVCFLLLGERAVFGLRGRAYGQERHRD